MANAENLESLAMTRLEELLKECMRERKDIEGRILTAQELYGYVSWMYHKYGHTYGKVTQEMLPFFTPDNAMTSLAEQLALSPENPRGLAGLSRLLAQQNEEEYIAREEDIAVGRMLRYFPGQWHTTSYVSVFYDFSGDCPIHFENEVVRLKKGSVLIVGPGVVHATPCYSDDAVLAFYMMRSRTFKSVFWNQLGEENLLTKFFHRALENDQSTSYLHFETGEDPQVRHVIYQVYRERQEDGPYASQMAGALMQLFFLLLLRGYEGTARLPRTGHFFWKHEFSGILSYIQTHYAHATLKEVGDRFGYSTRQVSRIVQDCTGETFGDLIRSLKMRRAAELLLERRLSPEDVAEQVGYSTVNSFYRAFKDAYGMPPASWAGARRAKEAAAEKGAEDGQEGPGSAG